MSLLEVEGLTRRPWFAGRDLTVEQGEIVVLQGPTGSGKTLFLRTVADLDPSDEGTVRLDGVARDAMPAPAWRRQVLYVHQAGVRLPGTVRENLARVAALLERDAGPGVPGLEDDADADRLSGGERQALALHRALCVEPCVLLLDESTSAMDAGTSAIWERRLRDWADGGRGILWVAHDQGLVDRVRGRRESFP
jgi:phosphate-transporting ATPase